MFQFCLPPLSGWSVWVWAEIRRDHQPSGPGLWEQDKEVYHRAHCFMNIISIWIQLISCINLIDLHNMNWIVASRCPPHTLISYFTTWNLRLLNVHRAYRKSCHPLISIIQLLCSHSGALNVYSWTWFYDAPVFIFQDYRR